jgi:hypothetical protein
VVKEGSKSATKTTTSKKFNLSEKGYIGLNQVNGRIYEESRDALRFPNATKTFKKMSYDPVISAANSTIDLMIGRVQWFFDVPDTASDKAKEAAEFLNYCMNSMDMGTWEDFITECGSYRRYGFHIAEKVYNKVKEGKWKGKYKWKKLPTRAQDTIEEWVFSKDNRELLGLKQSTRNVTHPLALKSLTGYIEIPRSKFIHFAYDGYRDNPEGRSPLVGAYIPWTYKTLIEEYEAVGVAKDLGGIPLIGVDVDYLAKAQENPASAEAAVVEALKRDAANMHSGDQSYMLLPLAYTQDGGKPLFDFKLVGVDGGLQISHGRWKHL